MKVGLITIFDSNYGNRLQNYAAYIVLTEIGLDVTTLYVEPKKITAKYRIKKLIHEITRYHFTNSKNYWKYNDIRIRKFDDFNYKYIPSQYISTIDNLSEQYDYFIVGSDQVWNPSWYDSCPLKKDAFLLTFANTEKKVCFSPSFGLMELPEEWKEYFKNQIQTFPNISVREEAGARIIKELTGKTAEVLIDPTLMLSKEDWIRIENKPNKIDFNKEYVLTYFLGEKTVEQEKYINSVANINNFPIYNLLDYGQSEICIADPCEFIYLIHNAKVIFTDSFHACVFSFIFGKPFQVFQRSGAEKNMMSRIETLLSKFSLQRKLYGCEIENNLFECDYSEGYEQLKEEQDKVRTFLRKSLSL